MEWVEVTGKTVEEAKESALDKLGVDRDEAEFEVLEEPRPGLFGRLRSEARVRARVMPTSPRPKVERRERSRGRGRGRDGGGSGSSGSGSGSSGGAAGGASGGTDGRTAPAAARSGGDGGGGRPARGRGGSGGGSGEAGGGRGRGAGSGSGSGGGSGNGGGRTKARAGERRLTDDEGTDAMGQAAGDYEGSDDGGADDVEVAETFLNGLIEAFGATCTIERREVEDGLVELSVHGDDLGLLIGPRGQTLMAVQELARTAVQRRSTSRSSRLIVDIAGYRQARRVALERFASEVADRVKASGVASVLEPMPPADRKVVHDAINLIDGVSTSSEGEDPHRRVVISPSGPPA